MGEDRENVERTETERTETETKEHTETERPVPAANPAGDRPTTDGGGTESPGGDSD